MSRAPLVIAVGPPELAEIASMALLDAGATAIVEHRRGAAVELHAGFRDPRGARTAIGHLPSGIEAEVIEVETDDWVLTQRGAIFCIAAGNSGHQPNTIACPGCVTEAITVAAVGRDGKVASFSSRGGFRFSGKPDVAAPGVNIYSGTGRASQVDLGDPGANSGYAAISGTSMATPHITGLVALLRQRNPALTAEDFKTVVRRREFNPDTGRGVPNWSMFVEG